MQSVFATRSVRAGRALKLAITIGTVCMILGVGELCSRFLVRAWPFEEAMVLPSHMTERDVTLRWRYSPADGRNSLGLKNREIGPKLENVTRILFLGDSLVWSGETSSGRLYTEVLEANLNSDRFDARRAGDKPLPYEGIREETARGKFTPRSTDEKTAGREFTLRPESLHYEVINAGVPGYTTYQELEFLRIYGLAMEPDLVVLCFVVNDVYFPYLHKPTADKTLGSEPSHHLRHLDTGSFPGSLLARSYLAHLLSFTGERAARTLFNRPKFPFQDRGDFYLAWKAHGWNDSERLLATMQEELFDRGIDLAVVAFPIRDQVDAAFLEMDRDYVLYPQRRLSKIADRLDIPLLDLTPALIEAGGTALFADSLHLGPEGNDVVAEVMTEFLVNDAGQTQP